MKYKYIDAEIILILKYEWTAIKAGYKDVVPAFATSGLILF